MAISKDNYNGLYVPHDGIGSGHLNIAGKETLLKLLNSTTSEDFNEEVHDLHGTLIDGSRTSLLECVRRGKTKYRLDERAMSETRYFPHYILIGEHFISSTEDRVKAINYHFENVDYLVRSLRTFGMISPGRDEYLKVLEADHQRSELRSHEQGWESPIFEPEVGEHPFLLYFSGVWEIVKCTTPIGSVTMHNRTSHNMGSSKGIGIENEITVRLEFLAPKTVGEAVNSLITLHSFFELCLGKRQRYLRIEAELVGDEAVTDNHIPTFLELYWSYCNEGISGETSYTHPMDVLLDPGTQNAEFSEVISEWLGSEPSMGNARSRFASVFHFSDTYGIDRIVGAANMFELLPETHVPSRIELDKRTKDAVKESRALFKTLPECFARDSMLAALGRVGKASLRDKICHRADILINNDPIFFANLHLPCRQAVRCRNHYVHDSKEEFNYREEFTAFAFLIDTLEFVFAVSDLIELGWDYKSWCAKNPRYSHRFGYYLVNYNTNLKNLQRLLSNSAMK